MSDKPVNVLLIEDNPGDARLIREMLEEAGAARFELAHAERLDEGLKRLGEEAFDVVLLDLGLPDSQGFDTLARAHAQVPGLPIVVLSGLDDEALAVQAVGAGAQDYLIKGQVSGNLLVRALRYAIERKRTEEALRESEVRYRALFEQANDAIHMENENDEIIDVNRRACEMMGYSREELLTMRVPDLQAPEVRGQAGSVVKDEWARCGNATFEALNVHRDGTRIPVEVSISRITGMEGDLYISIVRDITERKQAEETLERRAAQLALLNDIGEKIAAILELDSVLDRAARLVQESFGYHHVALFTLDREQSELVMRARAGEFVDLFPPEHRIELGQGIVGWVGCHGERLLANDVDAEPRYANFFPGVIPTRSELSVPIRMGEEIVGVLDVQSRQLNAFDENDVMVMETLADQIAVTVENARLFERAQREIAERKRAEEALRESEEKYRGVVERASDGITIIQDKVLKYVNPRLAEMRGDTVERILGTPFTDYVHPEALPEVIDRYKRRMAGEKVAQVYETTLRRKDGSKVYAELNAGMITYQGEPADLVIVRDITERVRAREELERRLEQLTALNRASQAVTASLELDRVLAEIISLAGEVTASDYTSVVLLDEEGQPIRGSEIGLDVLDLVHRIRPAGHTAWIVRSRRAAIVNDVAEDGTIISQEPGEAPRTLNPHIVKVSVKSLAGLPLIARERLLGVLYLHSLRPYQFHGQLPLLSTFANQAAIAIEHARLYDEIRRRLDELTILHEIGRALTSTLDVQETLTIITDHTIRLLGVAATSVLLHDETSGDLWFTAASGVESDLVRGMRLAMGQGVAGWVAQHGESVLVPDVSQDRRFFGGFDKKTGFTTRSILCVPLQSKGQTIGAIEAMNKEGGPFGQEDLRLLSSLAAIAATAIENARLYEQAQQEIAERKRAEEALAEERALLARRVEERTADLSAANAELAKAARLKDEFLASMSHELRTPLNAVLGLSEALQEQVYGPLNEEQTRSLCIIEESGRHLLDLINDILDVAKIGAGKLELEIGPVSVESVCRASLGLVKQAAHRKQLKVSSTFDGAVTMIQADGRRLKQILANLLSNAVKFTPEGGAIGLEVVGDAGRRTVHFTVWDTGIGIAPEGMNRMFQPFVQLDSSLSRRHAGTGLGLTLVYRLTEMHGGSVSLESQVGQGSRFTISLPWQEPVPSEVEGPAGGPTRAGAEPDMAGVPSIRRVLIVEDSSAAAGQLTRYLGELGVETVVHPREEGAAGKALAVQPDVIILDILLPDPSGWDVLEQLKAEPRTRDIPVLIVSVVDERSRGLALGAAGYLVKPISRPQLRQALSRILPQWVEEPAPLAATADREPETERPLILLAEDNEGSINTVLDYLLDRGYRVVVARDGAEALERAREERPDLILMDVQMPGMDGLEATRHMRADADLADVPIIALTALAMPGDRERCLEVGANEYLSKPVSLRELVQAIAAQMEES